MSKGDEPSLQTPSEGPTETVLPELPSGLKALEGREDSGVQVLLYTLSQVLGIPEA